MPDLEANVKAIKRLTGYYISPEDLEAEWGWWRQHYDALIDELQTYASQWHNNQAVQKIENDRWRGITRTPGGTSPLWWPMHAQAGLTPEEIKQDPRPFNDLKNTVPKGPADDIRMLYLREILAGHGRIEGNDDFNGAPEIPEWIFWYMIIYWPRDKTNPNTIQLQILTCRITDTKVPGQNFIGAGSRPAWKTWDDPTSALAESYSSDEGDMFEQYHGITDGINRILLSHQQVTDAWEKPMEEQWESFERPRVLQREVVVGIQVNEGG